MSNKQTVWRQFLSSHRMSPYENRRTDLLTSYTWWHTTIRCTTICCCRLGCDRSCSGCFPSSVNLPHVCCVVLRLGVLCVCPGLTLCFLCLFSGGFLYHYKLSAIHVSFPELSFSGCLRCLTKFRWWSSSWSFFSKSIPVLDVVQCHQTSLNRFQLILSWASNAFCRAQRFSQKQFRSRLWRSFQSAFDLFLVSTLPCAALNFHHFINKLCTVFVLDFRSPFFLVSVIRLKTLLLYTLLAISIVTNVVLWYMTKNFSHVLGKAIAVSSW